MIPAARTMVLRIRVINVPAFERIEHTRERSRFPKFPHSRTVLFNETRKSGEPMWEPCSTPSRLKAIRRVHGMCALCCYGAPGG